MDIRNLPQHISIADALQTLNATGYTLAVMPKNGVVATRSNATKKAAASTGDAIKPTEILSLRKKLGMTREQFAKKIGVSSGSIFGWEKGKTQPRRGAMAKIRKVLASA